MKALRLLPTLIVMCLALNLHAQQSDTTEIYYSYELEPTGSVIGADTVYQAYLIIDTIALNQFKKLIVLNEQQEKVITIKSNDLGKDPSITTVDENYLIAIDQWTHIDSWMVVGEKEDNSKKNFTKKEKEKKHRVIHTPIPVNYSLRSDTTLVNLNEL